MTDLLASRWTVALAEALVTLLGQGVLVAVLHEVARLVVGPGRPRARYALASVALFALPACLVATWWSIVSAPVPRGVAAPASAGLAS
ncbi:MAG: hypothetical protein KC933_37605, partial [Myxococcales bacterium]|nr:hypothetical protein [Myxococcales bacterium]